MKKLFDYAEQLLPDTYPTLNCIQKTFGSNIYTDYSDFIERKTHTCFYDSSLFRRYLEYLHSLPTEEYRKLPEVGNADFDKSDELYQNQVLPCGSSPQAESVLYIIGMPTCK